MDIGQQPATGFTGPLSDIWRFNLRRGRSDHPANGACLMDAFSWLEYGHLGDQPKGVDSLVCAVGQALNDALGDGPRQELKRFLPMLALTESRGARPRRLAVLQHAIDFELPAILQSDSLFQAAVMFYSTRSCHCDGCRASGVHLVRTLASAVAQGSHLPGVVPWALNLFEELITAGPHRQMAAPPARFRQAMMQFAEAAARPREDLSFRAPISGISGFVTIEPISLKEDVHGAPIGFDDYAGFSIGGSYLKEKKHPAYAP